MDDRQSMSDHDLLIRIDERTEEMRDDLEAGKKQFAKHDTRIRRIEMWFVPVLAAMSIVAHKVLKWFGA